MHEICEYPNNSLLATGTFEETIIFGKGEPNETTFTSEAWDDFFIARYNPDDTLAWAKTAGGLGQQWGTGVCNLSDNSIVVSGFFHSRIILDKGESNETLLVAEWSGHPSAFISKFNPNGNLVWAKQTNGLSAVVPWDIAPLNDDSVLIAGQFSGSATFGKGEPNETTLKAIQFSFDIFIAKYKSDGTLAWARHAGGKEDDRAIEIHVFSDSSFVISGYFESSSIFGEGEPNETELYSQGSTDAFLAKYNMYGELIWAKSAGGSQNEYDFHIDLLPDESILVTAAFQDTAIFGAGEPNETSLVSAGERDIIIG